MCKCDDIGINLNKNSNNKNGEDGDHDAEMMMFYLWAYIYTILINTHNKKREYFVCGRGEYRNAWQSKASFVTWK